MTCLYEKLIKMAHGDLTNEKLTDKKPKASLNDHESCIPIAQTYFSIPEDLETLENMTALEYLKRHVWLSSQRQDKCKKVFLKLTKFNSNDSKNENDSTGDGGLLTMVFLGVALVDLFNFPATHQNISQLYEFLDHDTLKFREMDFRTWCGISAFSERMVYQGPLRFENLEIADFKYLKTYGDYFDIPPALMRLFNVIQKSHATSNVLNEMQTIACSLSSLKL